MPATINLDLRLQAELMEWGLLTLPNVHFSECQGASEYLLKDRNTPNVYERRFGYFMALDVGTTFGVDTDELVITAEDGDYPALVWAGNVIASLERTSDYLSLKLFALMNRLGREWHLMTPNAMISHLAYLMDRDLDCAHENETTADEAEGNSVQDIEAVYRRYCEQFGTQACSVDDLETLSDNIHKDIATRPPREVLAELRGYEHQLPFYYGQLLSELEEMVSFGEARDANPFWPRWAQWRNEIEPYYEGGDHYYCAVISSLYAKRTPWVSWGYGESSSFEIALEEELRDSAYQADGFQSNIHLPVQREGFSIPDIARALYDSGQLRWHLLRCLDLIAQWDDEL